MVRDKAQESLRKAVSEGKKIRVQAYSVSDAIEQRVHEILKQILTFKGRPELISAIYTCLKELLINAVKANFKNIYFEDYNIEEDEQGLEYQMALELFKLEISRDNAAELARIARRHDLSAEIIFQLRGENELVISVENPIEMTPTEKENVRRKLEDARMCNDISEYFLEVESDPNREGAGIGLVLIAIMLRNLGVTDDKFLIRSEGNRTLAEFSIPLDVESTFL